MIGDASGAYKVARRAARDLDVTVRDMPIAHTHARPHHDHRAVPGGVRDGCRRRSTCEEQPPTTLAAAQGVPTFTAHDGMVVKKKRRVELIMIIIIIIIMMQRQRQSMVRVLQERVKTAQKH